MCQLEVIYVRVIYEERRGDNEGQAHKGVIVPIIGMKLKGGGERGREREGERERRGKSVIDNHITYLPSRIHWHTHRVQTGQTGREWTVSRSAELALLRYSGGTRTGHI
jgi:hypothetical protein